MYEIVVIILIAYVLDLLFGDPRWLAHPVKAIGWLITKIEMPLRNIVKNERIAGVIFTAFIVIVSWIVVFFAVQAAGHLHLFAGLLVSVFFVYSGISVKDLKVESLAVYDALQNEDIISARKKLSMIVARDTKDLDKTQIIRATVETIAESIVDGIISPLFYAFIGGAPLVIAYKAVNTMDSMVGYKNKNFINFGWASAKLDDLVNFIPARISAILLPIAALLSGKNARNAWKFILRDGNKHPSPNSGIPEAGVAGALGVQLGGINYYQGKQCVKPFIADMSQALKTEHIKESLMIVYVCSFLAVLAGFLITR
ncbi:MAG: cobalamin biosynthesis protein CobD [Candidatus Omnitrophica bacterium]|nr:cobalamin biosynthesis protein CobD [Candidatus Omnitrophota bacterium]